MLNIDPIYTPFTGAETRQIFNDLFATHEVEIIERSLKKSITLPERGVSPISFSNFFEILEAALCFRVGRAAPDCAYSNEFVCDFLDTVATVWQDGNMSGQGTQNTVDYCLREFEGYYPDSMMDPMREIYILTIDEVADRVQRILLA